jgi:hypothetical protein
MRDFPARRKNSADLKILKFPVAISKFSVYNKKTENKF